MRTDRRYLLRFWQNKKVAISSIAFLFIMLFLSTVFLSLARGSTPLKNSPSIEEKDSSYIFYFNGRSGILLPGYRDNIKECNRMKSFIAGHAKELRSGKSHLSIVTHMLPSDLKNPLRINDALVQASVIRAYIKVHSQIEHYAVSFVIDTLSASRNVVRVDYLPYPVSCKMNQAVYYTLNRNNNVLIKIAVNKNNILSFLNCRPQYILSDNNDSTDSHLSVKSDSLPLAKKESSSAIKDPSLAINGKTESNLEQLNALINAEPAKRTFIPLIGLKTNLFYWGGITSEMRHRDITPNIELEYYFARKWSLNVDRAFTYLKKKNSYRRAWALSTIGIEPRFWLKSDGKFEHFYVGAYGLAGNFDVKLNSISADGHTGDFYEGGLSLGYYLPISSHWGLEAGGRYGYRSVSGDLYYFIDPHYCKQSSFKKNSLELTAIRLLVTYRFGKSVKVESDK